MSRQTTSTEVARSARRLADMKQKGSKKGLSRGSVDVASPTHLPPGRSTRRGLNSHVPITAAFEYDDEEDIESGRASTSRKAATRGATTPVKKKPEYKRNERKASVRKETYDIDDSGSDLTDAPEQESDEDVEEADTESDGEMAKKLQEAGDGESLLGSASDGEEGETDEEEERFIIEDVVRRQAKRKSRRSSASAALEDSDGEEEDGRDFRDGTLSPRTMEQLGLDGFDDDLFAPQDPFHSSSEPSFTDFFGSGSEDETEGGMEVTLEPRPDDNELTTDDEDSDVTDISDLDESMLSAPFLAREALAAGASTQIGAGGADMIGADVPLLVIEDLDGRLIYARAGDGEAVFGSDGEFECVDDSDEEDTDEDMDGLGFDYRNEEPWGGWRGSKRRADEDAVDSDEGDTTDELPNEDMPFPRLLIGSVAPHGGRNARRARALAAKSKRLTVNRGRDAARSRAESVKEDINNLAAPVNDVAPSAPTTPEERVQEIDFSISTEALARDPQGTLEAAAKTLGLTPEEVARLVAGLQETASSTKTDEGAKSETPVSKPKMGSFMPTSFKSVRRAVIDGNRQAPSPFSSRYAMQKRGLANRTRRPSIATPSSKRVRRLSTVDGHSQHEGTGEDASEVLSSSHEGSPVINAMELDDVLDASMLWRGSHSSSPPASAAGGVDDDQMTPIVRPAKRPVNATPTSASPGSSAGLNLNAFARWHRIPMGAFRDGQGAANSSMAQQPLGSFLLTRSSRANQSQSSRRNKAANQNHSPFRGRGEGDTIHLGTAPQRHGPSGLSDAFVISPVLWPVKHGAKEEGHSNAAIWYTPKVTAGEGSQESLATPGKSMTTKREKRQKRARKAALKAALQGANGETAAASWAGSSLIDSPATAMPRLSITDISPRVSPLATKVSLPPSSLPMDIPTTPANVASHPISHSILSTSGSSSGSLQQPPSSVFGIPLHSPLFGGIMDPPNLGFRDDLEDRDGDGILTI